jgi:lipopolysaccharide export system protein LptA
MNLKTSKVNILFVCLLIGSAFGSEKTITRSLYSYFNQKSGELVLKGDARILRENFSLFANEIYYQEEKKEAFAKGQVRLVSPDFTLYCGQMRVYLKGGVLTQGLAEDDVLVIAQKHPRLVEKLGSDGTYTQITAVEIKFYKQNKRVEAFENVRLVRFLDGAVPTEEVRITGDYLEVLSQQKKILVKNNVELKSEQISGIGNRLIYYQADAKFYLIGKARLREYDAKGRVRNEITSHRILHLLKEKRTIQMGGVEGILEMN